MKKIVLLSVLMAGFAAVSARADIPAPPAPINDVLLTLVEGQDAADLNASLKGRTVPGFAVTTGTTVYKVFRSSEETFQIVCSKFTPRFENVKPSVSCTIYQSRDGKKLEKFEPLRRLG